MNKRYAPRQKAWIIAKRESEAKQAHPDKLPCALCGLFYRKVMNHVRQVHKMHHREYKLLIDAPVSKGLISREAKEHMSSLAYEYKQDERLMEAGKGTRYVKGDPKAKLSLNKGRKHFAFNPDV